MPLVEARSFLIFLLIFVRVGGLVMTAPVLGPRHVPARFRLMLALVLALFVTPLHQHHDLQWPGNLLMLTTIAAKELMLGLSLGLAVLVLASGVQLAGHVMAEIGGFRLGDSANFAATDGLSAHGQLLYLTALAVFAAMGGHRQVMGALLDTFVWMPPGQAVFSDSLVTAIVDTAAHCFSIGLRASAPVAAALLMATLLVGLISRTVQQLNTFGIGLTANAMVILAATAITLSAAMWTFQEEFGIAMGALRETLQQMVRD